MTYTTAIFPTREFFTENTEDGLVERSRDLFFVAASNGAGRNFVWVGDVFDSEADATRALKQVVALASDPDSQPEEWREIDPSYGSDAWDSAAEHGLACFEADAFGEPPPAWH